MMKRLLLLLISLPILWFLGRAAVYAFVSDETRLRWHVEEMVDGYNSGSVGDVVRLLQKDWRHEGIGMDREMLHGGLIREFFEDRHPTTKQLLRRVDLEDEVQVQVSGDEALVLMDATFLRQGKEEQWREVWTTSIEAEFVRTDRGWRVQRTRHEDHSGTYRSR